jgi:hypothetical protein
MSMKAPMKTTIYLAALLALASCESKPAFAQNQLPGGLTARGTPAASDIVPCEPAAGPPVLGCTARAIAALATTAVAVNTPCNGSGDDTAAIQAALNAGGPVTLPSGVCVTSANLTLAYYGQIVSGQGRVNKDFAATPGLTTVIRPTSAVTHVFVVDGTAISSYAEGDGIQSLTVDMTNMADAATSVAFWQGQGFDDWYFNVSVVGYGHQKLSWSFNTGSYTTKVQDSQGGIVAFNGASYSNAATTITLLNDDILSVEANGVQNINAVGGAIQGVYTAGVTPIVYLAPGVTPYGFATNTTGLYAAVMSEVQNSIGFTSSGADWENGGAPPATCTVVGWSYGTYNDGTHGCLKLIEVIEVASTASLTTFVNPTFAGMYLLDYGTNTRVIGQGTGYPSGTDLHNGQDLDFGAVHGFGSNAFGFTSLASFINSGTSVTWILTPTGHLQLQPSVDADAVLYVKSAGGTALLDCATSASPIQCVILNGGALGFYSDNYTTQTAGITAATGHAYFAGGLDTTPIGAGGASTGAFTTLSASTSVTAASYKSGSTTGVTCSGAPSASFAATAGIVTHC